MTAINFIRVNELSKSTTVVDLDLPLKSLYLLAAPSTPEKARVDVIALARARKITAAQVKENVTKARPRRAINSRTKLKASATGADSGNGGQLATAQFCGASVPLAVDPKYFEHEHESELEATPPSAPPAVAAVKRAVASMHEKYVAAVRLLAKERRIEEVEALIEELGLRRYFHQASGVH
jgi:hypothetical protein